MNEELIAVLASMGVGGAFATIIGVHKNYLRIKELEEEVRS